MCLAVPSKIVEIDGYTATVDVMGLKKKISVMLLPEEPKIGDYVLVHAGFAINKIETTEAEQALKLYEEIIKDMEAENTKVGSHSY